MSTIYNLQKKSFFISAQDAEPCIDKEHNFESDKPDDYHTCICGAYYHIAVKTHQGVK